CQFAYWPSCFPCSKWLQATNINCVFVSCQRRKLIFFNRSTLRAFNMWYTLKDMFSIDAFVSARCSCPFR
ncbi:hypothetical protein GIB67_005858, partial [Kingdonia uniflora]